MTFLSLIRWQESLIRFKHVFGLKNKERFRDIRVYFLAGNHDNGYAALLSHKPEVLCHFYRKKYSSLVLIICASVGYSVNG